MSAIEADARLVRELCDVDEGLTQWEINFVESIAKQVIDKGRELTEKQRETARKILERVR